jgi:hypothetical protein
MFTFSFRPRPGSESKALNYGSGSGKKFQIHVDRIRIIISEKMHLYHVLTCRIFITRSQQACEFPNFELEGDCFRKNFCPIAIAFRRRKLPQEFYHPCNLNLLVL